MERGYEILPKDITFRRYAYWFRDFNLDKWTLAREGQKHYNFKRNKEQEKITLENLKFETVSEQKIYDNATDAQKRYLAKYITVFRC